MSDSNNVQSRGLSTLGLLGVVFVTLKLLGITAVASWSWWWVTAPFWGGLAVVLAATCLFFFGALLVGAIQHFSK